MKAHQILAVSCLLFPISVAAAIVEIRFDEKGHFQHAGAIPPGKFVEVCGKIAAGSKVGWSFETEGAVDFNIHYHVGQKVEFPEKIAGIERKAGTLDASSTQDYCWMWKSAAPQPLKLKVELRRMPSP